MMQRTGTQPIILIVEDYTDTRQMLKLLLEGLDYRVLTAATGYEGLAAAANNHIDLVLTDFSLPDMTGATLIRRLRQLNDHLKRIPTVVLTAFDGSEYRDLAAQAGCNAFIVKPPDFDTLKITLERLLQGRTVERFQENSLHGKTNVKVDPLPTSL